MATTTADAKLVRESSTTSDSGTAGAQATRAQASEGDAFPDFARLDVSSVDSVRVARRRIAILTPVDEIERLGRRHQELAFRRVTDGLSQQEDRELRLIRWELDQIEDAKNGEALDMIRKVANMRSIFADQIEDYATQLEIKAGRRKPTKRKKASDKDDDSDKDPDK